MTHLSVNLNKIALVRNSRQSGIPSVLNAARIAIAAGARGITVHPRPDERHIRRRDVTELADFLREFPAIEFNIEGNPLEPQWMDVVLGVRPHQATLVPDATDQLTSDHGWNLTRDADVVRPIIARLQQAGIRVSLFVDADPAMMPLAKAVGADRIELYTGPYAEAFATGPAERAWEPYRQAAEAALAAELGINAGHDLSLENLGEFLAHVPGVLEVSIGHALIADALELGLSETVRRYVALCQAVPPRG